MIGRLALLAIVIGAVVIVAQWSLEPGDARRPAPGAAAPDAGPVLRAAELEDFDATGRLRLRVRAARIELDPADGSVKLDALSLDDLARPGQTWQLHARHGEAPKDLSVVQLRGDVALSRLRDREPRKATVRAAALTFDAAAQTARSDGPVRLEIGRHTLEATGMVANMKRETLRLESRVRGRFDPFNGSGGRLQSESAIVSFRDNRVIRAEIAGTPAEFAQTAGRQAARGHAGRIVYDVEAGTVRLAGDAWLSDGHSDIKGETLVYSVREERVVAAAEQGSSRVRITINPQSTTGRPGS